MFVLLITFWCQLIWCIFILRWFKTIRRIFYLFWINCPILAPHSFLQHKFMRFFMIGRSFLFKRLVALIIAFWRWYWKGSRFFLVFYFHATDQFKYVSHKLNKNYCTKNSPTRFITIKHNCTLWIVAHKLSESRCVDRIYKYSQKYNDRMISTSKLI